MFTAAQLRPSPSDFQTHGTLLFISTNSMSEFGVIVATIAIISVIVVDSIVKLVTAPHRRDK